MLIAGLEPLLAVTSRKSNILAGMEQDGVRWVKKQTERDASNKQG